MKKLRLLFSVVVVIALISSFAMAAPSDDYSMIKGANDDYTLNFDGETLVVDIVSNGAYGAFGVSATLYFDTTVWTLEGEVTTAIPGAEASSAKAASGELGASTMSSATLENGTSYLTATFKLNGDATAAGSEFRIDTAFMDEGAGTYENCQTVKTYTVKEAGPVGPVSVATTMTVKGTEYTDVPNATVENVNYVDGVITGALNIDYWKDGAAQPAKVIPAAKFVGMPANVNVTGTGTVSFTVALMGVPTDVTITGISFK